MTFLIGDNVIVRESGKRGRIVNISTGDGVPYQIDLGDGHYQPWFSAEALMLRCDCENVMIAGCTCGVAKREKEQQ